MSCGPELTRLYTSEMGFVENTAIAVRHSSGPSGSMQGISHSILPSAVILSRTGSRP